MLSVIITAGGVGKRMGATLPKQFLLLHGKPILMHTIESFHRFDSTAELLVTLPEEQIHVWKELCALHGFVVPHQLVAGGEERFHSIQHALKLVTGEIVAVHDGVRPLIDHTLIKRLIEASQIHQAVVPVVPIKESLRQMIDGESKAVVRSDFVTVQTPQLFHRDVLIASYQQSYQRNFTDDASVVEAMGKKIETVVGSESNIKITQPIDLQMAEYLFQHKS
jgi:2-C-methyl-D-erythritol 4-phosphate cytidylyltransferase